MPLVDMKDMLHHAYRHGYAVGAFDLVSLDFLEGIMMAAEQARAPVILNLVESHFESIDIELVMPAVEAAAARALVPVAIHLDHSASIETAVKAINRGCNGVKVDAAHLDFTENTHVTKAMVETAHACGVAVEGELGCVPGVEGENAERHPGDMCYTSLAEAKAYVERTGVDFLAIAIGTMHGDVKGKPKLEYQRLKQINEKLAIPLVIHGGTGLSDDQYRRLISNGVAKINYFTALSKVAVKKVKENTRADTACAYTGLLKDINHAVATEVERCMRMWGSAGRAAEVLAQCAPWAPVEHLIMFNIEGMDKTGADMMMAEGQRVLSAIPGVREVFAGEAMQDNARYHYTWLVRFCHPALVDSYHRHPDYVAFNARLFRTTSEQRVTIDFQTLQTTVSGGAQGVQQARA
jgi:fructose-bisphosphate aldolase class II